jgi:hypothetical protein
VLDKEAQVMNSGERTAVVPNMTSPFRQQGLPWYMKSSGYRPSPGDVRRSKIWPELGPACEDRIEEQLMIGPEINPDADQDEADVPLKKIYLPNGLSSWQVKGGRGLFLEQKCPVDRCVLTGRKDEAATADAIMFKGITFCVLWHVASGYQLCMYLYTRTHGCH